MSISFQPELVRARLRPFGISFEKSLTDLIKGIRLNNSNPERLYKFLEDSIQECKDELKTNDSELKSMAVLKLAYLEMYGFDMSWCSFQVLEVMSSFKFQHKRIGYLAALEIFMGNPNDDALMLMTNLLKKDLHSSNYVETGLALSGIATIVTPDLAQDICEDIVKMLNHSKPFIRTKSVLAMYKIFLKYPEALRNYFPRVEEKLKDEDTSVVSATVNVICELSTKNPKNYIDLVPQLFELFLNSNNNWMMIRLLKLFSSLSLVEPRLKFKLLPEILKKMQNTQASSLVYECINCILTGRMLTPADEHIAEMIIDELVAFFQSDDQNLRYVGLLAFIKTVRIYKKFIRKHEKVVLAAIDDEDLTIKGKVLDIVHYLVTADNIVTVVQRLLMELIPIDEADQHGESQSQHQAIPDSLKLQIITEILKICSAENYASVPSFEWYLAVLKDLMRLNKINKVKGVDKLVSETFIDIAIRVPSMRSAVYKVCIDYCITDAEDQKNLTNGLKNFVWILGEYYIDYIQDDEDDDKLNGYQIIADIVSQPGILDLADSPLSDDTLAIFISSLVKLFAAFANEGLGNQSYEFDPDSWDLRRYEALIELNSKLIKWLSNFEQCINFEIQERACSFLEVLKLLNESLRTHITHEGPPPPPTFLTKALPSMFNSYPLKPIGVSVQAKIPKPTDLDLELVIDASSWEALSTLALDSTFDNASDSEASLFSGNGSEPESEIDLIDQDSVTEVVEDVSKRKKERLARLKDDPYYISLDSDSNVPSSKSSTPPKTANGAKKTKTATKTKPKPIRREKVLILDDEEGGDVVSDPETKPVKSRKKKLIIDSSNLDNFDITAEQPGDVAGAYEVEQLRKQLVAESAAGIQTEVPKAKTKVTKKKSGTKKKGSKKLPEESALKTEKKKKRKAIIDE
ncbi:unnamed protein product [Kuraishia capsulata CBS 1993]|uniref:AP-3 complex subunit delta n=1 Tax=Kuraishia capsulata CBS 1993 TaxID=1382522 RepID=W6MKX3_9ASCO|nr:uncharacterized protein KUCA_T00001392001 [Kuraishia capsulata CBS 1993]CDK25422.1 unnamed protein product [Kuraishia capsulata CBS 1993]